MDFIIVIAAIGAILVATGIISPKSENTSAEAS